MEEGKKMTALVDRLALPDSVRVGWLGSNDTFLLCELNKLFLKELFIRGRVDPKLRGATVAQKYFDEDKELDYFIYSSKAPTHCGLKYVDKSRIMFYRPSKTYGVSRSSGMRHTRQASCRFVRLKEQILTIFDEEIIK